MIDRVAIIWANGSASIGWPLTDVLYKLEHVAALTAVFGPSHDKLSTYSIVRHDADDGPAYAMSHWRAGGVEPSLDYYLDFGDLVEDLLRVVAETFDDVPDRSGFHKEDQ